MQILGKKMFVRNKTYVLYIFHKLGDVQVTLLSTKTNQTKFLAIGK
jgi:hypothetical protein